MARQLFSNNAKTNLSSPINAVATVLTVDDGSRFSTPGANEYELITIESGTTREIVRLTSRTGNSLTVTRAQESTSAAVWAAGAVVEARATAETYLRATNAGHGSDSVEIGGNAADTRTIAIGSGSSATIADAVAVGPYANASTGEALALGHSADATGTQAVAVGSNSAASGAQAVAVGVQASAAGIGGVAIGHLASAATGQAVAIGRSASSAELSVAIGDSATASDTQATAVGFGASAASYKSVAIGTGSSATNNAAVAVGSCSASGNSAVCLAPWWGQTARIEGTAVINPQVIPRSDGAGTDAMWAHPGVQMAFATDEIDFKVVADYTVNVPGGCFFWVDRIDVVFTESDSVTVNPTIRSGVPIQLDAFITAHQMEAAVPTGFLAGRRYRYDMITFHGGIQSTVNLSCGVTVGATGTTLKGRFIFVGILVEKEV